MRRRRGVTPVVIDASAGAELVADTVRRALRALLPADAVPWVPETFFVEVGSVLRRWDLDAHACRAHWHGAHLRQPRRLVMIDAKVTS